MKKILCFGDSNTFGFNPLDGSRYLENERWGGILKEKLKEKYLVIEQGCNNRSAVFDNNSIETTGYKAIKKYLTKDIDIIILQIGINDMQFLYDYDLEEFKKRFKDFIGLIRKLNEKLRIILLCPNEIDECILKSGFNLMFNETSIEKSKCLIKIYDFISQEFNCDLLDLNSIVETSKIDGLHYDIENHQKIANALLDYLL